jgi:hypothetical protein
MNNLVSLVIARDNRHEIIGRTYSSFALFEYSVRLRTVYFD